MKHPVAWWTTGMVASLALAVGWGRGTAHAEPAPDVLRTEIEALQADKVAWREIAWKSCLIEGLKESREKKKPVLLWVFIDRPADDARC
jgi:hypothetical protein